MHQGWAESIFEPSILTYGCLMNNIIYIVGLVVIVLAVLSYFGFR